MRPERPLDFYFELTADVMPITIPSPGNSVVLTDAADSEIFDCDRLKPHSKIGRKLLRRVFFKDIGNARIEP